MTNKLDNTNEKYIIGLKLINIILKNADKKEITDLLEFKNINRQEIVTDKNLEQLNSMENELYKHFDKVKCGYYRKTDNYVINFLRGMIKQLGYKMIVIKKDNRVTINKVNYRKTFLYYHIE
jgi:hypothetical protein